MTSIGDGILVMLEAIPYEGLMQRHQHLARELGRFLPVVYAEETPSRLRRFLDGKPFDPSLDAYKNGLVDVGGGIRLFKAPPCMPRWGGYRRSIEATSRQTATVLKQLLPKDKKIILWLSSPSGLGALGLYDETIGVFDCFDAFGEFPGEERYREEIIRAMEELARRADMVLATSGELRDRLIKLNPNTKMVQNGCDSDHFVTGSRIVPSKPVLAMESLPRPIIGYMGDIAPWLDLDMMHLVAKRHPTWTIVLLGTWKRSKHPIQDLPNVHAPGRVPYGELPYYAGQFDVGTIPFELNNLTRVVNPLKLYEYFAIGKPVVATDLPEVARYDDLAYIARSKDEFVALAEVAAREPVDSPARITRTQVAQANSWRSRADTIIESLEELLKSWRAEESQS